MQLLKENADRYALRGRSAPLNSEGHYRHIKHVHICTKSV